MIQRAFRQWRQLDHMHMICTSLQTGNHASTSSLNFFTPNQQCQSTEGKKFIGSVSKIHWNLTGHTGPDFKVLPPHHTRTILCPFFRDHPGEPVPEENFWTLWCRGRLTEADTLTIQLCATPSGLTSAHLHHTPIFFTGRMPFLPPNQQCQSTEGN